MRRTAKRLWLFNVHGLAPGRPETWAAAGRGGFVQTRRSVVSGIAGRDIHVARRSGAFRVHAVLCASRGSDAAVVLLRLNEHVVSVCQRTLMLFLCVGSGPQTCSFLILLSVLLLIVCSFRMPVGTGGVSGRTYAFAAADIQFAGSCEWVAGCQRGRPV